MLTIAELADMEKGGFIVTDNRALPNEQSGASLGVALRAASRLHGSGAQPVYRLVTRYGYTVTATPDHRFLTQRGYVALGKLQAGDRVLLQSGEGIWSRDERLPQMELFLERVATMAHGGSHATGHTVSAEIFSSSTVTFQANGATAWAWFWAVSWATAGCPPRAVVRWALRFPMQNLSSRCMVH